MMELYVTTSCLWSCYSVHAQVSITLDTNRLACLQSGVVRRAPKEANNDLCQVHLARGSRLEFSSPCSKSLAKARNHLDTAVHAVEASAGK